MKEFIRSERGKSLYWIIGILAAVLFAIILLPPLFSLVNKPDPLVLGFPFSVFWFFVIAMVQGGLVTFLYYIQKVRGEL